MANDGGPAFPTPIDARSRDFTEPHPGMTLRDYFAAHAPEPTADEISREYSRDKMRNPHNEAHKPKLRVWREIVADLAYEHADAMLKARGVTP